MVLHLSRKHHAQLLEWARDAGNQECCGLLLGHGNVVSEIESTRNVAADMYRHFEIDPVALIAAYKRVRAGGDPIIGYFHSHPHGLAGPSATDIAQAATDGRYWLIIADGAISVWQPVGTGGEVVRFQQLRLIVEG